MGRGRGRGGKWRDRVECHVMSNHSRASDRPRVGALAVDEASQRQLLHALRGRHGLVEPFEGLHASCSGWECDRKRCQSKKRDQGDEYGR